MKNIFKVLGVFALLTISQFSFSATCSETSTSNGQDDGPTSTLINSFPCASGGTITAMTLDGTLGGGGASCPTWNDYDIYINGALAFAAQCTQAGLDISAFLPITSVELRSNDNDAWSDNIDLTLTLNITYTTGPMTYSSTAVTQNNTSDISLCSSDQQIIGIEVVTTGGTSPFDVTQFRLRTNGADDWSNDISGNVKVYYTGTSSTFSTVNLFGSQAPLAPGNNFTVTGAQTLSSGTNYFWVAYDVASGATIGNNLDAICNRVVVNSVNRTPSPTTVAGNRTLAACIPTPGGVSETPLVWLQGSSGTTPSTGSANLSSWTNSGSNGGVTINGSPDFTDSGYNFNPTIHFTGDGDYLSITGTNFTSLFVVAELEDLTRYKTHINTYDQVTFGPHADGNLHGNESTVTAKIHEEVSTSYGPEFTGAGVWKFDGVLVGYDGSYTGNHDIMTAVGSSDIYSNRLLGGQVSNAPFDGRPRDWKGDVSEYIMFTNGVSTTDRHKIESYLAIKYGKTLGVNGTSMDYNSTDNTVVWDQSANSGYAYDITGIGRADATGLDQRKSQTENKIGANPRDLITIANGTNFSSPTSFSADQDYLVWGHNDLTTQNNGPADVPGTIERRFARVWKAQESGGVGTVTIQLDMSAIIGNGGGAGSNDLNDVRLLVDGDGVFAAGATIITPSSVNNTTDIVQFQHNFGSGTGFFFTLGSVDWTTASLPIELLNFDVECSNNIAKIEWSTLSEINNDYFSIEKSTDGISFIEIEKVEGAGNSNEILTYNFIDDQPYEGVSYYRLKQTDFDGKFSYSAVKFYRCSKLIEFGIYPNPVSDALTFYSRSEESVEYQILSIDGKVVLQGRFKRQQEIDLSHLSSGSYFVRAISKEKIFQEKLIKQ